MSVTKTRGMRGGAAGGLAVRGVARGDDGDAAAVGRDRHVGRDDHARHGRTGLRLLAGRHDGDRRLHDGVALAVAEGAAVAAGRRLTSSMRPRWCTMTTPPVGFSIARQATEAVKSWPPRVFTERNGGGVTRVMIVARRVEREQLGRTEARDVQLAAVDDDVAQIRVELHRARRGAARRRAGSRAGRPRTRRGRGRWPRRRRRPRGAAQTSRRSRIVPVDRRDRHERAAAAERDVRAPAPRR